MSMNRNNQSVPKRRFQLFRGNGEAERLDRFLADADPLSVAPPKPERRKDRSGKGAWSFVLLLGAASLIPILWQSWPYLAEGRGDQPLPFQEQTQRLVDRGKKLLSSVFFEIFQQPVIRRPVFNRADFLFGCLGVCQNLQ